jgi:hypothetical protein
MCQALAQPLHEREQRSGSDQHWPPRTKQLPVDSQRFAAGRLPRFRIRANAESLKDGRFNLLQRDVNAILMDINRGSAPDMNGENGFGLNRHERGVYESRARG